MFTITPQLRSVALISIILSTIGISSALQRNIPGKFLRIADVSWGYMMQNNAIKWTHAGGDWIDKNGAPQGLAPFSVSSSINLLKKEQEVMFDVTSLVLRHLGVDGNKIENRGWILMPTGGEVYASFYSIEANVKDSQKPNLQITFSDGTKKILTALNDVPFNSGSRVPQTDSKTMYANGRIGVYFDLTNISANIVSAKFVMTTNALQEGNKSKPLTLGVFPVSVDEKLELPVENKTGLSSKYSLDVGLADDPNVFFYEDFADPYLMRRGWSAVFGGVDTLIVGDADPDDSKYQPLSIGKTALKWTIRKNNTAPQGTFGDVRYQFWPNNGEEPEELYVRSHMRLGSDFDGVAGKFPIGISGTYDAVSTISLPSGLGTYSKSPVTGRAWVKPNAPAYAGNGGVTSNGRNGWSARSGYQVSHCNSTGNLQVDCAKSDNDPLVQGGFRQVDFYAYYADQPDTKGEIFHAEKGLLGILPKEQWFAIEEYIKLNTVNKDGSGNKDGVLKIWINGMLALEKNDFRVRHWPGNYGGAMNIKIQSVWPSFIHGGTEPTPAPLTVYIANMVAAKQYIGPGTFSVAQLNSSESDPMCGTAQSQVRVEAPVLQTEKCFSGDVKNFSVDTVNGVWRWTCQSPVNAKTVSCSATKPMSAHATVNGSCGTAQSQTLAQKPASYKELCKTGLPDVPIKGNGPWAWSCRGSYGGTTATCSANRQGGNASPLAGVCGMAGGMKRTLAPNISYPADMCSVGTPKNLSGNGPWKWSCSGVNGGSEVSCSTLSVKNSSPIPGSCGSANLQTLFSKPSSATELCSVGSSTSVSGSGPWAWQCDGLNGGASASCSATLRSNTSSDGACGTADKTYRDFSPTGASEFCKVGFYSSVNSPATGPWKWNCYGVGTGSKKASCSAYPVSSFSEVPVSGSWIDIPGTKIRASAANPVSFYDLATSSQSRADVFGVIDHYSGAAFDSSRNRLIAFGGGHAGYVGNELYGITLVGTAANKVTRITEPDYIKFSQLDSGCNGVINGHPLARHTYGGVQYLPGLDKYFDYGAFTACGTGAMDQITWTFDFKTNTWKDMKATGKVPGLRPLFSAYDAKTGKIFAHSGTGFYSYDYSRNEWKLLDSTFIATPTDNNSLGVTIDPKRRKFVMIGSFGYYTFDLDGATSYKPTYKVTGSLANGTVFKCKNYTCSALGADYDPVQDKIVLWGNSGNDTAPDTVFTLDLDTGKIFAYRAANGPTPAYTTGGTFGRFRYVPALGGFVALSSVDEDVKLFKFDSTKKGVEVKPLVYGQCGPASGASRKVKPDDFKDICISGQPSMVSGSGPWNWTCGGLGAGTTASCRTVSTSQSPINGVCGSVAGVSRGSAPTVSDSLCANGVAGAVTTTTTGWSWSCAGTFGGVSASCSASGVSTVPSIATTTPKTSTAPVVTTSAVPASTSQVTDKTPPTISQVTVASVDTSSAIITWITDEDSTGVVDMWGSPNLKGVATTTLNVVHTVTFTSLKPSTLYYFRVKATDKSKNSTYSPNGSFKTKAN